MKTATCHPDRQHYAHGKCKPCYAKNYTNKDSGPESRETRRERHTKWRKKLTAKQRSDKSRKARYGLTAEEYDSMIKRQAGKCALCKKKKRLFVDHNHKTGKVRELLCPTCNSVLGHTEESVERLNAFINYIERHKQ